MTLIIRPCSRGTRRSKENQTLREVGDLPPKSRQSGGSPPVLRFKNHAGRNKGKNVKVTLRHHRKGVKTRALFFFLEKLEMLANDGTRNGKKFRK